MASRAEFTPTQKARIFCRDHATCAFTGKSLWILDYGATPFWETDWTEHVKPASRDGKADEANGVCAGSEMNAFRGNNTRGKSYMFREGRVTDLFCRTHGHFPVALAEQIKRLSTLHRSDWHFNRALKDILVACNNRWRGVSFERTWRKWLESALNHLREYQRLSSDQFSMKKRGLLKRPIYKDMELMLKLRDVQSASHVAKIAREIYGYYKANCDLFYKYLEEGNASKRRDILKEARKNPLVGPQVISVLKTYPCEVLPLFYEE